MAWEHDDLKRLRRLAGSAGTGERDQLILRGLEELLKRTKAAAEGIEEIKNWLRSHQR